MNETLRTHEFPENNTDFALLSPLEYFAYLRQNIPNAQHRVWLQTMNFEADHFFGLLSDMLGNAAQKNVDTRFTADYFHKMVTDGNIDYIPALSSQERQYREYRRRAKSDEIDRMSRKGVNVNVTNPPKNTWEKFMPASGRNHIKMGIIDDVAFIGGINLSDKDFSRADFMIQINQPALVDALAQVYIEGRPNDDYEIAVGSTSLLVDSGQPGKSLILDTGIGMVNSARQTVAVTSQFTPDGKLPVALHCAREMGKDVQAIVSDPNKITEPLAWTFDRQNALELRVAGLEFPIFDYGNWLHVKTILIDEGSNNPEVIVGTHNFSGKGVKWGNQEIALRSTDSALVNNVRRYMNNLHQTSNPRRK